MTLISPNFKHPGTIIKSLVSFLWGTFTRMETQRKSPRRKEEKEIKADTIHN